MQCRGTKSSVTDKIKLKKCYQKEVIHALLMTGLDFSDFLNQMQWTKILHLSRTLYLGQTPSQQQTFSCSIHFQISSKSSFLWAIKLPNHTSQYLSQIMCVCVCVCVCVCTHVCEWKIRRSSEQRFHSRPYCMPLSYSQCNCLPLICSKAQKT